MRTLIANCAGAAAFLLAWLVGSDAADGANIYWDGTGTSWNNVASWSTVAGAPTPNPAGKPSGSDVAIFNITTVNTAQTVNLDAAQAALGLTFNSSGGVVIQSGAGTNALTIGAGGINVAVGAGADTIATAVSLVSPQAWANESGSLFSVNGNISIGANLLTIAGSGNTTLGGVLGGGNGGLTKLGSGTLNLTAANTFTGGVFINAGTVLLGHVGALNALVPNEVSFGANSAGTLTLNGNSITVSGLSTSPTVGTPIVQNASATNTTLSIATGTDRTYDGVLQNGAGSGTLALVKSGAGVLTLRGANTYTGGTTISAGTLRGNTAGLRGSITNNAALVFDQTTNGVFAGQILGTGSLLKTGGGTLTFNGSGLGYSGETNVREGAILHSAGSNTQSAQLRVGDLVASNGTYTLTGTAVLSTPTIVVGVAGTGVFNQSGGSAIAGTQLTLGDDAGASGTYNLSAGSLTAKQVNVGLEGLGVFQQTGGVMVVDGDPTGGQLILGSAIGSSGTFNLSGGSLLVGDSVLVGSSGATAALNVSGTGALTVDNTLIVHDNLTSKINLSGGTINAKALNLKGVPANLNWTAGALNISSNVTWDSAAGVNSTSAAFGASLAVGANQTFRVTGNETLGGSGAFGLTLNPGGTHQVTGTMTVATNGTLTQNAGSTIAVSALVQSGGTINGTLQNQSTFVYQSGSFNGRLLNQGIVNFGSSMTLGNGVRNEATLAIGLNQTLNADGAGLDNQSSVNLNSGTLGGSGPLMNHSLLLGDGTIAGSGGFTNTGSVYVVGGTLALSNTGTNTNSGQIGVSLGQQLRLLGSNLISTGMIELEGGVISGSAMLNNSTGIVNGYGTISSPFANAGALVVEGGILAVSTTFANSGEVVLAGGLATLSGSGAMNNSGIVRGDGAIAKIVNNNAGGEIRAENGKRIRFQGSVGANAGTIQLQGGAVEFVSALTNAAAGQIQGRGMFSTGGAGLTNNGHMALSGGITDIHGDVHNATGVVSRGIIISGNADVTFWDDVSNTANSLFRVSSGSSITLFGSYSGSGISGNGNDIHLEADVNPGFSSAIVDFGGNVHFSPSTRLNIEIGGTTPGVQYDQVRVSEQLSLHGTLDVSLINGFSPELDDSFVILDWGTLVGAFADMQLPALAGSLAWNTSQLYSTGTLTVVAVDLPGDYNDDGVVDAADYVVWRKFEDTSRALPNDPNGVPIDGDQYDTWRNNFRESGAPGSGGFDRHDRAVPEQASFVLLFTALISKFATRGCRRRG